MFKNITQNIEGLTDLKIFVMIFSLAFFIGVIVLVFRMSKSATQELKNLPFDDEEFNQENNNKNKGEENGRS
jgi:cbb3-type cytochrome oxidase subunit 3